MVQAQSAPVTGRLPGARAPFEQALAPRRQHDGRATAARLDLRAARGVRQGGRGVPEAAQRNPNDTIALNNLAYSLAVRHQKPQEALPLAERADLLSPRSAVIYDTLGCIKHLLGDHAEAARLLAFAAQSLPTNVDVQLHAAVALAAAGRLDDAAKMLKAAAALDPKVTERPDTAKRRRSCGGEPLIRTPRRRSGSSRNDAAWQRVMMPCERSIRRCCSTCS